MTEGTWPQECVQRAFVDGAKWWQYHHNGSTMFPSERDEAEAEAVKRYGEPSRTHYRISLDSIVPWPKGMGLKPEDRYGHIELFNLCDAAGLSNDERTWVWGVSIGEKVVADRLIAKFREDRCLI